MAKKKDTLIEEAEKIKADLTKLKKKTQVLGSTSKKSDSKPVKKTVKKITKKSDSKPVKKTVKKITKKSDSKPVKKTVKKKQKKMN